MIRVNKIKKQFGANIVLNGVSLSVEAGKIYGLIGHNGAGKTTLMTIMAGLSEADSGKCIFSGSGISYLPDVPGFYDYLSCGEYMDFLLSGVSVPVKRSKTELLRMVGLSEKTRVGSMSRGMRQRLGIGASLVSNPDMLLLDEPTSALDPAGRMEVLDILKVLRSEGKAILLSTHVLADMENVCDKVGFLHNGIIKRQLNVCDLQDGFTWLIRFRNEIILEGKHEHFNMQKVDVNTYRIILNPSKIIEGQQEALKYLSLIKQPIESIQNDTQNLDAIFQEVCKA